MVFRRPPGILAIRLLPRGGQPRSGAVLVLIRVLSMKTGREGSTRSWYLIHAYAEARHQKQADLRIQSRFSQMS